jgi:hypothetical protein
MCKQDIYQYSSRDFWMLSYVATFVSDYNKNLFLNAQARWILVLEINCSNVNKLWLMAVLCV